MSMRPCLVLILVALAAPPLYSQQTHPGTGHGEDADQPVSGGGVFPPGWSVRVDEGGAPANVKFETMAPGFHLTMGSAAILYREADRATVPARVNATIDLFPGAKDAAHQEGFGLFIGGSALSGAAQRYTYFLVRGDGTFKIKRRNGATVTDLVSKDWKPSPAIPKADPAKTSTRYDLTVSVGRDRVRFLVGGKEVYSATPKQVDTDGVIGLRVNHRLSVHVERLEIQPGT
jgi:hypothetical protein